MASRMDFAVSATPVAVHATGEGQADIHSVAADIGKSIGGSGSITVTWADTLPTTFPTYMDCDTTAAGLVLNTDAGANDFIWIKNTGREYSSPTALGDASLATVDVKLGDGGNVICTLDPEEGILIPRPGTSYNSANDYYLKSSAGNVAIEWAVGT